MATALTELLSNKTVYTPCYCEENVYNLILWLTERGEAVLENLSVVFISNENKSVPIWKQRASTREDGLVIWDYHVILIDEVSRLVWDLDSILSQFPTPLAFYFEQAFQPNWNLGQKLERLYRMVSAKVYLENFASDRRHMKKGEDWIKPPPLYSCIINSKNEVHTLDKYLLMESSSKDEEHLYGKILFQTEFLLKTHLL